MFSYKFSVFYWIYPSNTYLNKYICFDEMLVFIYQCGRIYLTSGKITQTHYIPSILFLYTNNVFLCKKNVNQKKKRITHTTKQTTHQEKLDIIYMCEPLWKLLKAIGSLVKAAISWLSLKVQWFNICQWPLNFKKKLYAFNMFDLNAGKPEQIHEL